MNQPNEQKLLKTHIPFFHEKTEIEQIHKGYSPDRKYLVRQDGEKYLLRTFDAQFTARKRMEYEALIKMEAYNVLCSRPLIMDEIPDLTIGYMILTYLEGNDASEDLPNYSSEDQYSIGYAAGKELIKIHQLSAPTSITDWYDKRMAKHKRNVEEYLQGNVRIKRDSEILTFIEDHLSLMKGRPNHFLHHDFHVGNLIVKDQLLAGVIDFNRFDWGDPIDDFFKTGMFSTEVSIPFSKGQLRGYFNDSEPGELFWQLYSLYIAMCLISSVVWIGKVKPEETNIMMDKINRVLSDHDYFELCKPKWYS